MKLSFKEWLLNEESAIERVPYLDNMPEEKVLQILSKLGYTLVYLKGGYRHFRHPDGSEIKIRPDGRIKRIGPKIDSDDPRKPGKFQPKYIASPGEDGQVVLQRHTFYLGGAKSHGIMDLSHDSGERILLTQRVEWEGNRFSQEGDLVNNPAYPASKWKGPGEKEPDVDPKHTSLEKIDRDFGFKKSRMRKKLNQ
jgi:predicted RNA binding protein YcfA (HicA-like mRNA interferase family)